MKQDLYAIFFFITSIFIGCTNTLQKPIASILTSATTVKIAEKVGFNASTSSDADGEIISYTWKDVEGNVLSNQVQFSHSFEISGEHNITLIVMDDDEQIATATAIITVQAELLLVSLSIDTPSIEVNETTTLQATANYNDNTTEDVTSSIEWIVSDTALVSIDANGTLKALQSGTVIITARVGEVDSNAVSLEIIPQDTTPPVVTLNGESEITLILSTTYTELGITATDDRDDNVTITQSGTVDSNTVGTYNITYTAHDKAGNESTVTRTVHVVLPPDVTPPVLTLNGESIVTLYQGADYTELGATAIDDRDLNVTVNSSGEVKTSALGTYVVTYTAQDSAGNSATIERTVNVVLPPDTIAPMLTLNGESEITLFQNVAYTELGATATDERDGDVNVTIVGEVDSSTIGIYTITYTATDSAGNSASIQRAVNVVLPPDVTAPVITLNGESAVTVFQGTSYVELGATATDDRDANVSVNISGNVDSAILGSYTITYTATDTAGNSVTEERTVNVVLPLDTEAPVITLNGDANITLTLGESYAELGATAHDQRDGDVNVTIEGSVDTSVEGIYSITYMATDKAGNVITVTRTVTVVAPTLTSLSLESNVTILNVGETAELSVMVTYGDGSTSNLDANIEYIITPSDSAEMNGTVLTAKKDSNVTVQAKINGVLSNRLNLTIVWIVNGHVLPPEPDPTVNDSTLLGIDVNDNGVRDDVERWIYEEYKDKHPIYADIGMQASRGYKLILETPERAKEIHNEVRKARHCEAYYRYSAKYFNEPILIKRDFSTKYLRKKLYFNTQERKDAYRQYDTILSGGSYTLPSHNERKSACDFNTNKYEE